MVLAWFMDSEISDQRLEHHRNPPEYISLEDLYQKTGVEYFKVSIKLFARISQKIIILTDLFDLFDNQVKVALSRDNACL